MNKLFTLFFLLLSPSLALGAQPAKTAPSKGKNVSLENFSIDLEVVLAPYNYSPQDKEDPFSLSSAEGNIIANEDQLTGAQQYNLEEFKVLGLIWNYCSNQSRECKKLAKKSRVMLADPTNKIHYLGKGDFVGKRGGYIELIREGEVVVIEPFRRKNAVFYRSRTIPFKKLQEGDVKK